MNRRLFTLKNLLFVTRGRSTVSSAHIAKDNNLTQKNFIENVTLAGVKG